MELNWIAQLNMYGKCVTTSDTLHADILSNNDINFGICFFSISLFIEHHVERERENDEMAGDRAKNYFVIERNM